MCVCETLYLLKSFWLINLNTLFFQKGVKTNLIIFTFNQFEILIFSLKEEILSNNFYRQM